MRSRGPATSTRARVPVPVRLTDALALAPARVPARGNPARRWALIEVDEEAGVIRRPNGVRFDSGGIGKGLAADLVAERLAGQTGS